MMYVALVVMTMLGAVASLCLKKSRAMPGMAAIIKSPWFYAGGFLYLSSAVINIILLKYLDYSIVLPFTSLTYLWSTILAVRFLKERVSKQQLFGLFLVIVGVCLIVSL